MNRIVNGLKTGAIQANRSIIIQEGTPYYVLEFKGERVGLFVRFGKATSDRVYFYSEYCVRDAKIQPKSPAKNLMTINSLNEFFKSVIAHNHHLAQENKPLSENYIVAVHFYDHNTKRLEQVDLNDYAPALDQKNQLSFINMYYREQTEPKQLSE